MRRPGERACLFPFDRGRMFIAAAFFSLPCTRLLFASLLSGRRLLRDRHPGHCRVSGRGGRVQRRCSRTLCSRGEGARFDGTCSMESSAVPADSSAGLCFIGGGNHRLRRRQRPRPYHREAASTTASSAGEPLTSSTDGVISGLSGFISWGGQRLHRQREFSALEAALPIVSPAGGASLTSSAEGGTAPASLAGAVPISLVGTALISISGWALHRPAASISSDGIGVSYKYVSVTCDSWFVRPMRFVHSMLRLLLGLGCFCLHGALVTFVSFCVPKLWVFHRTFCCFLFVSNSTSSLICLSGGGEREREGGWQRE